MPALRLDTPVKYLKGVGEFRAKGFERLGIHTVQDLLWHLPFRYLDASSITPLAKADVGTDVACIGRVVNKGVLPTRRRLRIFHAVLRDASGLLECVWPGQAFLDRSIDVGDTLLVTGPVRYYHGRQMQPREHMVLGEAGSEDANDGVVQGKVMPVYPATEGLSHKLIRMLIDQHLDEMVRLSPDVMSAAVLQELDLLPEGVALRAVHRPQTIGEAEAGRRRLAFDELLDLQLMLGRARLLARTSRAGIRFEVKRDLTSKLRGSLPWQLTDDQKQSLREITADMTSPERMHRLLMGDVGTGKTVVALFAMLLAMENGYQSVLMAPTELLAEQHSVTLSKLLAPLGLVPDMLIGRLSAGEKAEVRRRVSSG
ncbi:MAG TPA: DEAD/DEAH box helicase, partial [Gemmatimonadales bacterium]|nr:DEAD/DEAH box helicase [Gemmatimonadales bacterium]